MWTHLERQAGGQVKGMGEKQIEVDKRILRTQVSSYLVMFFFYVLMFNCNFFQFWLFVEPPDL